MKKALLTTLPVAAFVAGMAVVPNTFADEPTCNDISAEEALRTALGQCETINLKENTAIPVTGLLEVKSKSVTLNLNGGSITRTNTGGNSVFNVEGQSLTVNGPGKIEYSGEGVGPTRAITANAGGTVTVNSGELVGDNGIAVWGADAKVYFKGGTITATGNGINGNGAKASSSTIEISGGTINAGAAVVYMPQSGTLNITGGTQTGYIGVVTRAGVVNITGGTLRATGDEPMQIGDAKDVKFPGGVAVIVDNKTPGYNTGTPKATIGAGATIEAANSEDGAVLAYENPDNTGDANITIAEGATFNGAAPKAAYLGSLVIGSNNQVMTQADADKMAEELANQNKSENPNTADPIALYATVAAVALIGLSATAVMMKKSRR